MDGVTRIGVSLEPELLKEFDKIISKKGYVSRSEAIRDLVRDSLAENEWKNDKEFMSGVIVMIYDHGVTGIGEKLTAMQHGRMQNISTTIHVHLDHDRCMEVLIAEGELGQLKLMTNDISSIKGVLRCKLTMASQATGHMHHLGVRH
ncbi:MAG: nickel-responsive transcriptional regulator NikR [Candidatus Methanoplasma sp.]|jgi:CopG family nickel-responsive transcriptional regulator|nr:nickel-responsive transcriptional regulator NikR [Candidatus Methanoplasma sp.]